MQLKNQIINYFVADLYDGDVEVFQSPITMNPAIAKRLIVEHQKDIRCGTLLHVCLDRDLSMMYVTNAKEFTKDQIARLFPYARTRICDDFGDILQEQVIHGSPFSTLRVRSIDNFRHIYKHVKNHFSDTHGLDIPVIEANLSKMPATVNTLPDLYQNKRYMGGYIDKQIEFIEEVDNCGRDQNSRLLLVQDPPFILVNISPEASQDITEKEWVVLSGYRDYLEATGMGEDIGISRHADLYSIKRHLYLGWSFEEVSSFMLDSVTDFTSLLKAIWLLSDTAIDLINDGYKDPIGHEYYVSFKIDKHTFPLNIDSIMEGQGPCSTFFIDAFKQMEEFTILDYDETSAFVIIKTPAFLAEAICTDILCSNGVPFMVKYNPIYNSMDVKSSKGSYLVLKSKYQDQLAKIKALIEYDVRKTNLEYRLGDGAEGVSLANPNVFNIRRISEYYYAYDFLKEMCKARDVEFRDLDVVVGPIEQIMGQGTEGGFLSEKAVKKKNMEVPYKLAKGVYITPPLIMINSLSMPSYAQQTKTIIHEYSHYLFSVTDPDHEMEYDINEMKAAGSKRFIGWYKYLNDEDEVLAHEAEIKYCLLAGESFDEIIRDKVGGKITEDNYLIALEFKKMVQGVVVELEKEKDNEISV